MYISKYNFLYRDTYATQADIAKYKVGHAVKEYSGLFASFLRGGLLSGCNLRFVITTEIGKVLSHSETDFRRRGMFEFEVPYNYRILDVYNVGDYNQVLLTPDTLTSEMLEEVIAAARKDFNQLVDKPAVQILDTLEWRHRVKRLVGVTTKRFDHSYENMGIALY